MAKITTETNRIEIHGDYLLIAPRGEEHGYGYWHMISERAFLVENIKNFFKNYPSVEAHQLMIYELRGLNGEAHLTPREPESLKAGVLSLPDVVKSESNLPA